MVCWNVAERPALSCVVGLPKSAESDSSSSNVVALSTGDQRTRYGVPDATCAGAFAVGRAGVVHAGADLRTTKLPGVEKTGGQTAKSPSTYQVTAPLGTSTSRGSSVVAPLPPIAAHTLYFVAPGDFVQAKCTGEAIGVVPSGGLCSSGATVRLQLSGGAMSNEKCADSSGPQPLKSATTHHSMWPGAK